MNFTSAYFYFIALVLAFLLSVLLAVFCRRWKEAPGSREFFGVAASEALLALVEILSLFAGNAGQALFWFKVRFFFSALLPVFWIRFALDFSRRKKWLSRALSAGLFVVPAVTQILIWTNDRHHLFVKREVDFRLSGAFWIADVGVREPGFWFLIYSVYGLLLLIAGLALALSTVFGKGRRDLGQIGLLSLGAVVAVSTGVASTFNLIPGAAFNPYTPGLGLAFFLFAAAVFRYRLFKRSSVRDQTEDDVLSGRSLAAIFFVFILLATGIVTASYFSFRGFEANLRAQAESQLTAVVELKSAELQAWRAERLSDAEIIRQDGHFADLVEAYFRNPALPAVREELRSRLSLFQASNQYLRALLVDMDGLDRMAVPPRRENETFLRDAEGVARVISQGRTIIVDLHREIPEDPIHLSVYIPIVSVHGESGGRPLGAVILWIDPRAYLYPFILKWPGSSATAETLLVRREGHGVVYLNDLKFESATALSLRFPLDRIEKPAVQAALGREGIFEGLDYRGIPVVSSLRSIPGSPWFLVARMDVAEIYAPSRERMWQTILLLSALLAVSASLLGMNWRRQRIRYFRRQAEVGQRLRDSLERFELANKATFDVIWDWNLRTDALWWNENFQILFGYSPEETEPGIESWKTRIHPEDRDRVVSGIHAVIDGGGQAWSDHYRFRCKDGRDLDIFDRGYVSRDASGEPVRMIGAMQDMTERIKAEKAALHSRDLMRYIIEHSRSAVAIHDRELRYLYVSQKYLDDYHVAEKDVIGKHHYEVFPDLPRKWRDIHQKALRGEISSAVDDPWERADGSVEWTQWECRPWREADGSIGGIIVYTEVVTPRVKANEALRASLREKEVLLKEIHHRVKNNMQIISSLLNLQASQFPENRFREAMKETQQRIRSMALLHEKLYKSRDLSRIDFVEYAETLAVHLFQSFAVNPRRIKIKIDMDPAFFDIATANPLGLILNELLSNTIKHAFPENRMGEIVVGLRRTGDEYLLTVRDDGIGLPPGFDLRGKGSFGMQIIDSLVEQLNAALTLGKTEAGTAFELRFQELRYAPRFDPDIDKTTPS